VRDPDSKAAPDWMILDHLAARLGTQFPYTDEKSITLEIGKVVPCYAGISWEALGDQGMQWDAKAVQKKPALKRAEQPVPGGGEGYALVTGTVSYDGGDLFSLTKQMQPMAFKPSVGIHPEDAARAGLVEGAMLAVRSDLGELVLPARLDATVQQGTVWIPESLTAAPVGTLLNGHPTEKVRLTPANA
jgi:predicted molibdopterin-dependent oxidoreductase YjgC